MSDNSNAIAEGTQITLKAGEVKVYTAQYLQLPDVPSEYIFAEWTDIEDIELRNNSIIYPTIAQDVVHIESTEEVKSVEVINTKGQRVITANGANAINVSALPQGIYMVVINYANTQEAHKIVKN